jgi:hypothetical protein
MKRLGREAKRRDGVQINILPVGDRYVVSVEAAPVSFKLEVARQLKIDPAMFIRPTPKRHLQAKADRSKGLTADSARAKGLLRE